MRAPANADRDKHLERIGFNLGEETALSSQACQTCGYDRIWTAERYRNWCVSCGTALPASANPAANMAS
jgi:hypothetical protein